MASKAEQNKQVQTAEHAAKRALAMLAVERERVSDLTMERKKLWAELLRYRNAWYRRAWRRFVGAA